MSPLSLSILHSCQSLARVVFRLISESRLKLLAVGEPDSPEYSAPALPEFVAVAIEVVSDTVLLVFVIEHGGVHFEDTRHVLVPRLLNFRPFAALQDEPARDLFRRLRVV